MSRAYEAMIVLDTKGKEDSVESLITQISREFEQNGAKLKQVDNLGRRKLPNSPRHVDGGFYINIFFEAEAGALGKIEAKLKLNEQVYQQFYKKAA